MSLFGKTYTLGLKQMGSGFGVFGWQMWRIKDKVV